ncbi:MAG TPA: chemotaxis protein CheW [Nocardioides sp.]|uniref:chemotaxis protein CheW n=1 Tax=uncultured Nocardioides sp. TaxID=198441 RepID=UPI0026148209|nr:chemotaxis protein CheW [uncultured Nocardioides sp.]HRD61723.1 chemotaxis protein CheW [Nocardioides sp.]HRI95370.1 chemotaxis protein CheW [Nocardioides sp.]HRK48072.1 chemotaxis protein CheW [Nocardioides sp.]
MTAASTERPSLDARMVTFELGDRLYGVDVRAVQEVLRGQPLTRVPLAPPGLAGLINLRGQVLTAMDLCERLGLPPRPPDAPEPMVVVVRVDGESIALLVDRIGGVVDVSDDNVEAPPDPLTGPTPHLIQGAYKLEGELLLALDVERAVYLPQEVIRPGISRAEVG